METVEILVFMGIAILLGMMILAFVGGMDVGGIYDSLKDTIGGKKSISVESVDNDTLYANILTFWDESAMCELNETATFYVDESGTFNKNVLFSKIRYLNLCSSLQSRDENCGDLEHVQFSGNINLPAVVRLSCNMTAGHMVIR